MIKPFQMKVIAKIHNDFSSKFGIPRQSGIVEDLKSTIIFEEDYRNPDAVRGLEGFSHIWIIWQFSEFISDKWSPTVRPPRLGGNEKVGVFASRSPFRPNSIGLSSVRLERVEWDTTQGPVLHVLGADLMDGTPIYDIKPYITYADSHPDARSGFVDTHSWTRLEVELTDEHTQRLKAAGFTDSDIQQLISVLEEDPRPQYHTDPEKISGMPFKGIDIHFRVEEGKVLII